MSKLGSPEPVKLISSMFSSDGDLLAEVLGELSGKYGRADFISEFIPFDYTDYYAGEMGQTLIRRFVSFESLVRPDSLPAIKIFTNGIEERFLSDGKRMVNIDPGYISMYHLILATGKGYAHRPYLGDGIYADLTLIYKNRTFQTLEWTYPDYAGKAAMGMFNMIREKYLIQLKTGEVF